MQKFEIKYGLLAIGILFLVGCVAIWRWIPRQYPIVSVQLVGEHPHVSQQHISAVVKPYTTAGFLGVNVHSLQAKLLKSDPWFESVEVWRIWPARLLIELHEYKPSVRWNQQKIITKAGILIDVVPGEWENALPLLEGPSDRWEEIWHYYQEIQTLLEPKKLKVVELSLAPWGSWRLLLDNGIQVILGRSDLRARILRFVEATAYLEDQKYPPVATIDLRYTNGFAVGWRTPLSQKN